MKVFNWFQEIKIIRGTLVQPSKDASIGWQTNVLQEAIEAGHAIEAVGEATPLNNQIWTGIKGGE